MSNAMYFDVAAQTFNALTSGISSYYGAKAEGYYNMSQAYAQAVPQYQQIMAQTRRLQEQQAIAYMNSNVDISQGTASYVIQKTSEQGLQKMSEVKQNLNTYISNTRRISSSTANAALWSGIMGAINTGTTGLANISLYNQQYSALNNNTSGTGNSSSTGGGIKYKLVQG